jgi:CheY-like chemotaxis protein
MARILLVEDNAANLELLRYLLTVHGHTVDCAADGTHGLRKAGEAKPDIVLCDLQMPRLDGYGLLREIRTNPAWDDVVVVAVTAYSMPDDRVRVTQAGFDGYLTKPISPETVVPQIEAFLAAGPVQGPLA